MAEAESAHTTGAPASSRALSYRDLNAVDGAIQLTVLMTLALRKARAERAENLAIGLTKPWRQCLSEALKRVWEVAKQQKTPSPIAPRLSPSSQPTRYGTKTICSRTGKTTAPPRRAAEISPPNWRDTQIDRHSPRGIRMTQPTLQVISGGAHRSTAEINAAIASVGFEPIMGRAAAEEFAARAEANAAVVAGLVTAAVAILAKSKGQLVLMITGAGQDEAAEGHDALKEGLAAADTLVAVLRAAEARFTIAVAAAALHSR
jgi:hypothetical protein